MAISVAKSVESSHWAMSFTRLSGSLSARNDSSSASRGSLPRIRKESLRKKPSSSTAGAGVRPCLLQHFSMMASSFLTCSSRGAGSAARKKAPARSEITTAAVFHMIFKLHRYNHGKTVPEGNIAHEMRKVKPFPGKISLQGKLFHPRAAKNSAERRMLTMGSSGSSYSRTAHSVRPSFPHQSSSAAQSWSSLPAGVWK